MFVRFRATKTKIQVSLIATSRESGKVRQEHIGSLGSISSSPTTLDRIRFWTGTHDRLAKLDNRLDAETRAKVLAQIHARIPMVTVDEQQQLRCEVAEADVSFYDSLNDMTAANADDLKGLVEMNARRAVEVEAASSKMAAAAVEAKERLGKVRAGEDVPGLIRQPLTRADLIKALGLKKQDLQHVTRLGVLGEIGATEEVVEEWKKLNDKAHKTASRNVVRRHLGELVKKGIVRE